MKTLVLGIGNPILRDDGIGPRVAEEAKKRWLGTGVDFQTTFQVGMTLVDMITGYDALIVIDAVQTGNYPGQLYWLNPEDFELRDNYASSEHKIGILQALKLAKSLELQVPSQVSLLAIEAADVTNFGEELTENVEKSIPSAVKQIVARLSTINNHQTAPSEPVRDHEGGQRNQN